MSANDSPSLALPGDTEMSRLNCATFTLTDEQKQALRDSAMQQKAERAARLPNEASCLRAMMDGFSRLKELGWRDAIYAPVDGSPIEMIEAGSTGIHKGYRDEEKRFWIEADNDLWPSRPILFRRSPETAGPQEGGKDG